MENKQGVIYILTNPSFPEYVKIGYADDVEKRLKGLAHAPQGPRWFTYNGEKRTDIRERLETTAR